MTGLDVLEVQGCLLLEEFHRHLGGAGRKGRESSSEVSTVGISSEGKEDGYSVPAMPYPANWSPGSVVQNLQEQHLEPGGIEQGFAHAIPSA